MEILLLAQWLNLDIQEVGIGWHEVEGSKINLAVDAIRMARDLFLIRVYYATGAWKIRSD